MQLPHKLVKGDQVAIVAPAFHSKKEASYLLDLIETTINKLGLVAVICPSVTQKHGYLSGRDEVRAQDINDSFANKDIKAIFCLRGGYGTPRILPLIDFELIKKNPKIFLGYSDITALHVAFNQKADLITYHGPVVEEFFNSPYAMDQLKEQLFETDKEQKNLEKYEENKSFKIENPRDMPIKVLVSGVVSGPIIGGNLSLLVATLGSDYELDTKGKLLFIEEVGESLYRIDRMLNSLALAGKFKDCRGLVLGTFTDCDLETEGYSLKQLILETVGPLNKPIIMNVLAGHGQEQMTLPLGMTITINTGDYI